MKKRSFEHIAKLDDYELPAEYPFGPRKLKRNRFAGRVKFTRVGARKAAGRKRVPEPIERHTITFYKSDAIYLRGIDPNLSKAIRKLTEKAR